MATGREIFVEDRIIQLLKHLKIERAHFASSGLPDWRGLAANYPEAILSLALVCPWGFDPVTAKALSSRLLVIKGDKGPMAEQAENALKNIPEAKQFTLRDYAGLAWDDIAVDKTDDIGSAILEFLSSSDSKLKTESMNLPEGKGEVDGISYHIQGSGPPLVLLPLMSPSQWKPVLSLLSQEYCTITLGGAFLGSAAVLETRSKTPGYLRVVQRVINELALNPEDKILDIGCGTGFFGRWLARGEYGLKQITGLELNPYLLGEAQSLVDHEGLGNIITLKEGNAESLPFDENSFSVTTALTVLEETNADSSLAEMFRVTELGGQVAVIVRAQDLPLRVNITLHPELKKKIEIPFGAGVAANGCADASLYQKFRQVGLSEVKILPDAIIFANPQGTMERALLGTILGTLNPEEQGVCRDVIEKAAFDGTFFLMQPVHCATGRKH